MPTPLDVLREIFDAAPFVRALGIRLEHAADGQCRTSLVLRSEHLQQTGVVHAGVLATLADHTAGGAAGSVLDAGRFPLTAGFSLNLLRAATGERLSARARVLKAGRTLVVAESEVFADGASGEVLVAKATVTMAVLTRRG